MTFSAASAIFLLRKTQSSARFVSSSLFLSRLNKLHRFVHEVHYSLGLFFLTGSGNVSEDDVRLIKSNQQAAIPALEIAGCLAPAQQVPNDV